MVNAAAYVASGENRVAVGPTCHEEAVVDRPSRPEWRRLQLGPFASMAFAFLAPLNASDFLRCSVALLLRRGYAATTKQKLNSHPGRHSFLVVGPTHFS